MSSHLTARANMDAKFHVLTTNNAQGLRVREHRKRRQHTKDKEGCFQCKQKRVKCDQRRPICLRCSRNNRECIFAGPPKAAGGEGSSTKQEVGDAGSGSGSDQHSSDPDSPNSSLGLASPPSNARLLAGIVANYNLDALNPWIKKHGTSVDLLLHHFSNNSADIMGQAFGAQFWGLAYRYTFLVPTILSVSACHLRHHTANPAPHHIAELGQESMAISSLRSALALPLQNKDRANALLYTAVMLNAINFASVENHKNPAASWVFSSSADRLGWLDLQLRFKKLEEATSQFRESDLRDPCLAINREADSPKDANSPVEEDADLEDIPASWRMLLGHKTDPNYRLFREPVKMLSKLRLLEPDCRGSFVYFGIVGKLDQGFRDLLFNRDPRALWIFGYWLGLIGRFSIWWCSRRVERDWAAVRRFLENEKLEKLPGDEGKMWRALNVDLGNASEWPSPEPRGLV